MSERTLNVALTLEEVFVAYAALGRDLLRARLDGLTPSPAVLSVHDKLAYIEQLFEDAA